MRVFGSIVVVHRMMQHHQLLVRRWRPLWKRKMLSCSLFDHYCLMSLQLLMLMAGRNKERRRRQIFLDCAIVAANADVVAGDEEEDVDRDK